MKAKTLILGAGFGGLELATLLSEEFGDDAGVVLIDRSEAFVPGSAFLDVLLGRLPLEVLRTPYTRFEKPGVTVLREEVTAIDPATRTVTTDAGTHEADSLVVALGATWDFDATPGLAEHGHNLYDADGVAAAAGELARFEKGRIVVGIAGGKIKCPPAPSAAALLIADTLAERGVRNACEITLAMPAPAPVPPAPDASAALLGEFERAGVTYLPGNGVASVDADKVHLADGTTLPYDLFLGVPAHRAPAVVAGCGLADSGFIEVNTDTLATGFDRVWAIGDVTATEAPQAGVFAEDGARTVAAAIIGQARAGDGGRSFTGTGSCYLELGGGQVSRIDVVTYPDGSDRFNPPTGLLAEERKQFGRIRARRWFNANI